MQRSDILQAAAQIFRQKGYHAASMQDIADAVQLQKASLYYHVESKQDILLAILDKTLDLLIEDLLKVMAEDLSPQEKLLKAIQVYVYRLTEDADLAAVLLFEYRNLKPDLRTRHNARRDRYEGLWREIICEGVQKRAFRKVDEAVVTFALLGVMNWMITWYKDGGRFTPPELAEQFCDLLLLGLRGDMAEMDG